MSLLIRLYPKAWRERYGEEFAEILAARPLGPFDVADVILGALDARLHLRRRGGASAGSTESVRSLRVGGYAAIAGGMLWLFVFLASMLMPDLGASGFLVILLATTLLLVALTCLSAFQARRHPTLVWTAFLVPAVGACVSLVGLLGMFAVGDRPFIGDASPWYIWALGAAGMIIGSGLFAIATWRVDALPRPAAASLGVGSVVMVPVLSGMVGGTMPEPVAQILGLLAIVAFAGGWVALGFGALGRDRAPSPRFTGVTP